MANIYEARWNNAVKMFTALKKAQDAGALITFMGGTYDSIVITDTSINLVDGNCSENMFEKDMDLDHGMYTPIKEYTEDMEKRFIIYPEGKITLSALMRRSDEGQTGNPKAGRG